jgi:hypothetical protein
MPAPAASRRWHGSSPRSAVTAAVILTQIAE